MKKLLCAVLSAAIAASGAVGFAADEEPKEKTIGYTMNETFDDTVVGQQPSGLKIDQRDNSVTVEELPSEADKSLKIAISTTEGAVIDKSLAKLTGEIVFEYEIMFENNGNGTLIMCFKNNAGKEYNLLSFKKGIIMSDTSGEEICRCTTGKFYKISVAVSTLTGYADIYVNHKKVANKILIAGGNIQDFSILRFHSRNIGSGERPIYYINNYRVYKSDMPIFKYEDMGYTISTGSDTSESYVATEKEVAEYMGDAVAMYVDQNRMYSHNEVTQVDADNAAGAPFVKDGRTLVPIRAIADGFDAFTMWNDAARTVNIDYENTNIEMTVGQKEYSVNGETHSLDVAPEIYSGRVYVPVRAVTEGFGKQVTYDKSGLIVISDKGDFWNYIDDLCFFRTLSGMLVFHQPSGEELVNLIKERYPNNAHPRTLATSDDFERLKQEVKQDAYKAQWYDDAIKGANAYFDMPVSEWTIYNVVALNTDNAVSSLKTLSFAYQMTGDSRYADRAIEEMKAVMAYDNWNPNHFLDCAALMGAVSLAYDWLYDYLTPEFRAEVRKALVDKGLTQVMQDYRNSPEKKRTYNWAQSSLPDNWNIVCNSGALKAAIIIADEEPELAAQVFDYGLKLIQKAILMYAPDGAWFEGPTYWSYTTSHYVSLMASMQTAFGDTFGYMDTPGVADTGYFITAIEGPQGRFNFHDAEAGKTSSATLLFLANQLNDSALTKIRLNQLEVNNYKGSVDDIIYYNTSHSSARAQLPVDYVFRETEIAVMRSNWELTSSVFAGFHAGKVAVYHGQSDCGQFIIDAYGTRFAADLGAESYSIVTEHGNLYRDRAEGHNTLVINPDASSGQHRKGETRIDRFECGQNSAFAVSDMTSAYQDHATSVKRGMKLTNNRNAIIVQDEIKLKEPSDVWWFMHTRQTIEIADDGKSAVIKGEHRDMKVTLMNDVDGVFTVMSAAPMETSPQVDGQNKNLLYNKLALHVENATELTIPVLMQFVLPIEGVETESYSPDVVPLDEWQLEESGVSETPALSSLKINGEAMEDFDAEKLVYSHRLTANEPMPSVTGEGNGKVTVQYTDGIPGYAVITVTSPEDDDVRTSYVIKFTREVLQAAPNGAMQLSIASVTASATPEAANVGENVLDGDLATRWSAQGKENLVFDLGSVQKVGYVGIAVYQDTKRDGRRQYFDVLVSEDGEAYHQVFSGETTGTVLEEEIFEIPVSKARYVKLQFNGSSVGEWNSPTECRIYGE